LNSGFHAAVNALIVSPRKSKSMISSRYMIRPFQTFMKAASHVIHVGDFRVLRDSTTSRFASSSSCVVPVCGSSVWCSSLIDRLISSSSSLIHVQDSMQQRYFRVYPLPMRNRFVMDFSVEAATNQAKEKKANKTVVATAGNVPRSLRSGHPFSAVPHL
jgi:hypothetical protein